MSEEMISRRDFLAGIGATLGLAAACSKCHVSAPCDADCATCPANQNKPADK